MVDKLNLTSFTEANTVIDMIEGIDTAAASQLGGIRPLPLLFLVSVTVILVLRGIRTLPPPEAFTAAFSVTSIVSILFAGIGWLPWPIVVGWTIGLSISAIAMFKSNSS